MQEEFKVCGQCGENKHVSNYDAQYTRKDGSTGYGARCKHCILQNQEEYRRSNPSNRAERGEKRKCTHCDSIGHNNKLSGTVLCSKHGLQFKRHGLILENTKFDENDYTISDCGEYAIINLRDRLSNKVGETLVDIEDLEKVIKYRIHRKVSHANEENPLYYAIAKVNDKNVRVHHIILGHKLVDHINNNGLDNRKSNLRKVCSSKNGMNQRTQARSRSGVTGVIWDDANSTWHANIKKNGVTRRLVTCQSTFDNAVRERIVAEAKLFKEYSANYNHDRNTVQLLYHSHDDNKDTFIEVNMKGNITHFHKIIQ